MDICRLRDINGNCDNGPSPKDICINKSDFHIKFATNRLMINEGSSMQQIYTKTSLPMIRVKNGLEHNVGINIYTWSEIESMYTFPNCR